MVARTSNSRPAEGNNRKKLVYASTYASQDFRDRKQDDVEAGIPLCKSCTGKDLRAVAWSTSTAKWMYEDKREGGKLRIS